MYATMPILRQTQQCFASMKWKQHTSCLDADGILSCYVLRCQWYAVATHSRPALEPPHLLSNRRSVAGPVRKSEHDRSVPAMDVCQHRSITPRHAHWRVSMETINIPAPAWMALAIKQVQSCWHMATCMRTRHTACGVTAHQCDYQCDYQLLPSKHTRPGCIYQDISNGSGYLQVPAGTQLTKGMLQHPACTTDPSCLVNCCPRG
jgi:hypothetical protein